MNLTNPVLLVFFFIVFSCVSDTDAQMVEKKFKVMSSVVLPRKLDENSGIILFNGKLITHNDSGGKPVLYVVDPTTGEIEREVFMAEAVNVDMEDIAQDDEFIYVADTGNNNNTRKNLCIYKINKEEFLRKDTVQSLQIRFSYQEQSDFNGTVRSTNFDAEALVCVGDALLLFTKNWSDYKTALYEIPKAPGNYELKRKAVFNVNGLITGASYDRGQKKVLLSGYLSFVPMIAKLEDFNTNAPEKAIVRRNNISLPGSVQIEGISVIPDFGFYLTAEKSLGNPAVLYRVSTSD